LIVALNWLCRIGDGLTVGLEAAFMGPMGEYESTRSLGPAVVGEFGSITGFIGCTDLENATGGRFPGARYGG